MIPLQGARAPTPLRIVIGLSRPEDAQDGDHCDVHRRETARESVPPSHHLAAAGEPLLLQRRFSDMEELGMPQADVRWVYQYRRCRQCGFALRVILRELPDAVLVAGLREMLARSFARNVPD